MKTFSVALAVAVFAFIGCETKAEKEEKEKADALSACMDSIRKLAKVPASVDFGHDAPKSNKEGSGWYFQGKLTAKDSFGSRKHGEWTCKAVQIGGAGGVWVSDPVVTESWKY